MKRKQDKNGLTLVEILVAVAIIAILAAGLYSVSNHFETQSKIKLTEATIELLSAALEQYRDFYGAFPVLSDTAGTPTGYTAANDTERLYCKLTLAPEAKKILNQINRSFVKDKDKDGYPFLEIVDAWDNDFHYAYTPGSNFPVIDSNGPNRILDDSDDISSRK